MIDTKYIEEIKLLDTKEAKAKLVEYAQEFNIKLNKTKTFDNMVIDLEAGFAQLAAEYDLANQEDEPGLTAGDLIDALDAAESNVPVDEVKDEAKELIDQLKEVQGETPVETVGDPEPYEESKINIIDSQIFTQGMTDKLEELKTEVVSETISEVISETISEVVSEVISETVLAFELPEGFSPSFTLLGPAPGYYTLPWWIYEWITKNPDWKENPKAFPHYHGMDTIYSLIYYIKQNGSVRIRETRNSSFVTLM